MRALRGSGGKRKVGRGADWSEWGAVFAEGP